MSHICDIGVRMVNSSMRKKTSYFNSYSAIFVSGTIISVQVNVTTNMSNTGKKSVEKPLQKLPITIHDQDIQS